jgi:hypothetical protein
MKQGTEESQGRAPLHLFAAANSAPTPVAEVLAVIGQQPIIVLAETRPGALDDLLRRILRLELVNDPHLMTVGKSG